MQQASERLAVQPTATLGSLHIQPCARNVRLKLRRSIRQASSATPAIAADPQQFLEQPCNPANGAKSLLDRLAAICTALSYLQPPQQAEEEPPQGALSGGQLTQAIQACTSVKQVQQLVDLYGPQMNAIHLSAALSHLPQITATSHHREKGNVASGDDNLPFLLHRLEHLVLQRLPSSLRRLMLKAPDQLQTMLQDGTVAGKLRSALSDVRIVADINWRAGSLSSLEDGGDAQPHSTAQTSLHPDKPIDPMWYTPWDLGPRQLATAVHGFAKLGHLPSNEWMSRYLQTTEQHLCEHTNTLNSCGYRSGKCFTPQELSMMGWGLAQMQRMTEEQQQQPQSGQHEGQAGDGSGGLGYDPSTMVGSAWINAYCKASQVYAEASTASVPTTAGRPAPWGPLRLTPQDLATIPWALAVVGARPAPGFLDAWCSAVRAQVRRLSGRDCGQLLWALARLGVRPPAGWLQLVVARVEELAAEGRVSPHTSACTMWALARMQYDPGDALVSAVLLPLYHQQQLQATSAGISNQRAQVQAEAVGAGASASQPQQGSSKSNSTQQAPAPVQSRHRTGPMYTARDAGMLLWALGSLKRRPPVRSMHALVRAVTCQGRQVSDQDIGHVFWALARLRYRPPPALRNQLLHALGRALGRRGLGPAALAQVLWGLSRAQYHVPNQLAQAVFHAAVCQAEQLTPQGAVLALYCAARSSVRPPHQQLHLLLARIRPTIVQAAAAGDLGPQVMAEYTQEPCVGLTARHGSQGVALRSSAVTGQTLVLLFWSLVKLRYRPSASWTRWVLAHTVELLPFLTAQEGCVLCVALEVLGVRPDPLWLHSLSRRLLFLKQEGHVSKRDVAYASQHCPWFPALG